MKKILAILLALALCVTCFAGCGKDGKSGKKSEGKKETAVDENGLEKAKQYLSGLYPKSETDTPVNYKLTGVVPIGDVKYSIEWTADNENVTFTKDGDEVIVNVPNGANSDVISVSEELPYILTATIKGPDGKTISTTFKRKVPKMLCGPQELILEEAYKLAEGETMETNAFMTGKITMITTPYSADFKNITVVIQIGDLKDKRLECRRLEGEGCEDLAVGDTITVSGLFTNYQGTIKFDQGCVLVSVEPGERVEAPTDAKTIVDAAYALAVGDSLPYSPTLTGTITEIKTPYDAGYGNISVWMAVEGCEDKPILCYRLKGEGAENLAVGDVITVTGNIVNYNGTIEFNAGCTLDKVVPGNGGNTDPSGNNGSTTGTTKPAGKDPAADSTLTVKQAIDLGASKAHNVYTEGKYYVTGEITEVYNDVYGNMKIKDKSGNILTIYGTFSADGSTRYDAMTKKPVAGDTITVYGIIGQYNGTPQVKNAWITKHTPGSGSGTTATTKPAGKDPAADSTLTVKQAIDLGASKAHNTYTTGKYYVSGKVTSVDNTQYGNMKIADDKGNVLVIYGSFGPGGNGKFAELNPQPKVGDTIKMYGPIGQYNGTPQMKNGYIEEINGKKPSVNASNPTNPPASSSDAKMVTEPKTGVAYKFGLNQTKKGSIYFFTGVMNQYYGATNTDASKGVDVYLEKSGSGYKIYFTDSKGVKQYIKLEQSGTYYNFTFGAEGSVFTWDADKDAMHAPCGDQECYMGTYGDYVTFGCLTTEKLKDSDYVAHFYTIEK